MGNLYSLFQKLFFNQRLIAVCLLLFLVFFSETVLSQTPGLIIRKGNVTGGAPIASPLDPNGDGWVSAVVGGFAGSDLGTNSEINYVAVPAPPNEPTGDLRRGSTGYFSEIVDDVNGNGFYFNSDGVNLRFRMRISGLVPGSKGYSALIDSDGKFGFSGSNADPNAVTGNPGFEYEVVYESNFQVSIYRVDGAATGTLVTSYNLDISPNHAQIAVAATADGGDPDYFYDWYVPISAFASDAVGIRITSSTSLRMTPTTVMAPKGAVGGPASDAYGDDSAYKNINDQWSFLIENQGPITPDGTNAPILICTAPTRVNAPITPNPSGTGSVSGIWVTNNAATTATITVYRVRGGATTTLGTVTATSGATWILSGLATGTLQNSDVIYATAQSSGFGVCGESNRVLVQACNSSNRPVAPTISCFTTRGAGGTAIVGSTVRVYLLTSSGLSQVFSTVVAAGGEWGWDGTVNSTSNGNATNVCGTGNADVASGTYIVTQTVSGCESIPGTLSGSQYICIGGLTATATPTVNQTNIQEDTQTLSGTAVASSFVRLFVNGVERATTTATGTGAYSFSIAALGLQAGNSISVRAQATGNCISAPASRTVVQGSSFCNLTTPTITTNDNGNIAVGSPITGFSSEATGTTITVYNNATDAVIGTTTVQSGGSWTLGSTAVASTVYYARHTGTSCGTSEKSNTATTLAASSATCGTITSPVNQNANTVSGTGYAPVGATVKLFIDGAEIGSTTVVTGGGWSITVNSTATNKLYAGGVLTTSIQATGQITQQCGSAVTVQCVAPAVPSISTTVPISTSNNNFSVTIFNSVSGVLYYIVDDQTSAPLGQTTGAQRGVSQFGNGGSLTLTSSSFMSTDGTYKFRVVANPLSGTSCNSQSAQFDVVKTTSSTALILPDFGVGLINRPVNGSVATNDVLTGTISYSTSTVNPNATLTLNGNGTYSFIATQPGVYQYTLNVCTSPNVPPACPESILTITIIDPAIDTNPPVANRDVYSVLQNGSLSGNVTDNDVDLSGTGLVVTQLNGSATLSTTLAGGTLTIGANGNFTLSSPTTPGTYSFTYTLCDTDSPQQCAAPTVVRITVYATGTANKVYANDDYDNTQKGVVASGNLLTNDTQLTGAAITSATTQSTTVPGVGTFAVLGNGDYTFTPLATFSGSYQFPYEALGASGASAIGTYHVTVEPFRLNPDVNVAYKGETINGSTATNDAVPSGSTYTNTTGALANATLTLNPNGTYTFTASVVGVYTYNIQVCAPTSPNPPCETKTLSITVTDPTIATNLPVANNDIAYTLQATPVTINATDNDQVGNPTNTLVPSTATLVGTPSGVVDNNDGTFTYTPAGGFIGIFTFQYTVEDNQGRVSNQATIAVTVYPTGSQNVVVANDDYANTVAGTPLVIAANGLLSNDSQLDNTDPIIALDDTSTNTGEGTLVLASDGSYTFTPSPGFVGTTGFPYSISGTNGALASGTAYFTVAPKVTPDVNVGFINTSIEGDLSTNDVVEDGSQYGNIAVTGTNPNTNLPTLNSDGSYTFTTNTPGVYNFTYDICAPTVTNPGCYVGTLSIIVTDPTITTNPPVANTDNYSGVAGGGTNVSGDVLENDVDLSGTSLTVTQLNGVALAPLSLGGGTLTMAANGTFSLVGATTPGAYSFTYSIEDGNARTATATASITIYSSATPNVVTAVDDYASTNGITPVSGNVLTNDTQLSGVVLSTVTNPGSYSASGVGSLVLNANGTYTFTPVPGAEGVASFVYTAQGTDGATASATLHITVYAPSTFTWTGAEDDNWCDPLNWAGGAIPTAGANVVIPSTTTDPAFDFSNCPVCINNLTIGSGVTVGLTGKLCVTGDLDSAGEVIGTGSISLEGTTPQTIIGEFNITNLDLNNSAGATITSGAGNMVNITESLILTDGALTTNDNLRLISDASGDAYIAPITNCAGVSIVGNVRVQKFVDGGNRAFRFIAHPFDGTLSLQQIRDYVHITGEGLDFNDTGNPSAFWYNTAQGNQAEEDEDTGWISVSSTNIGDWFKGRAVRMMFRGPRTQGGVVGDDNYNPSDVTYEIIGSVNLCDQTLVGLRRVGTPGTGTAGNSAFNFIGNPFPAAIDLKTIPGGSRTNIGANYYVWQPRTGVQSGQTVFNTGSGRGGSYVAEPFVGGTAALGQLATGTGFFVVADVDLAEITFTEANKLAQKQLSTGAAVTFREDGDIASRYGANSLQLAIDVNGEQIDRVLVYFDEETNAKVDHMDATKFENPSVNFFTVSEDDYAMAIDRRPWVDEEEYRIPLHILSPAVKFTLTVPDFDMESGRTLQLYDRHLDELITLEKGATYEFEVTDEQASKGHRFDIVMGIEVITSINPTADRFQAFLLPNPAQQQVMVSIQRPDEIADTHVRLVDIRGVMLYETTIKATDDAQISYEVGSLAKGVYLVEITHGKQRIVKRLMVN